MVGPCEFSTGEVIFQSGMPTVTLCGKPGTARRGVMWCEIYACDECFARWQAGRGTREAEVKFIGLLVVIVMLLMGFGYALGWVK